MNDRQTILLPYVEHMAAQIVAEKEAEYKRPLCATSTEILRDIHDDVVECMRELHREGKFKGASCLNTPMLLKKES